VRAPEPAKLDLPGIAAAAGIACAPAGAPAPACPGWPRRGPADAGVGSRASAGGSPRVRSSVADRSPVRGGALDCPCGQGSHAGGAPPVSHAPADCGAAARLSESAAGPANAAGPAHDDARAIAPTRPAGRAALSSRPGRHAPRLAPLLALPLAACLGLEGRPPPGFIATLPPLAEPAPAPLAAPPPPTPGAIWRAGHGAGLGVDNRARQVGDIVTIVLAERMAASKESSASAARSSDYALRLPQAAAIAALPAGLFTGGLDTGFDGTGRATQSNRLTGEISVTVAGVLANGALLLRGQKLVRLNRGDEHVQIEGVVRPEDIGPDNRVPSTRVAAARITYAGTGEIAAQARQGWVARLLNFFAPF
jgi:flagellar L-ring protein precursor FlgH